MRIADDDPYAPNRIRTAAVDLFGREGFGAPLRKIAEAANVSLGLIRHHFGSKADLRDECDRFVLEQTRDTQREQLATGYMAVSLKDELSGREDYLLLVRYILQAMRDGGPTARALFDHLVEDSLQEIEQGVAAGVFKPSRDPEGRARFLVLTRLGQLILENSLDLDFEDLMTAQLEIYTDGLLQDHSLLDTHLKQSS